MSQNHSFISYIRNEHSFTLTIAGISFVTSWYIGFRQRLRLIIGQIKLIMGFTIALKVKKVKLTLDNSLIKLLSNYTAITIRIARTRFVMTMKQLLKITYSVAIPKTLLTTSVKLFTKLGTWLPKIPKVSIVFNMLAAKFIPLWQHDPKTLATMDTSILADLDYMLS
jgi:hypothetical protein